MNKLVIVRGGGDIATGTICRLYHSGFKVVVLEIEKPTVIRRTVALAQCLFANEAEVEGVRAVRADSVEKARELLAEGIVPVLADPEAASRRQLQPDILVDAILAKKNLGTTKEFAPVVIGLGPGFTAGVDVHAVVETQRGHYLGRVYYQGSALPNTGIPGLISGKGAERVIRAPAAGCFYPLREIGDIVNGGDVLGRVAGVPVIAPIDGVLRGLINEGVPVTTGMKIGDVDPRAHREFCRTISDKARSIGGGVLEAILHLLYYHASRK